MKLTRCLAAIVALYAALLASSPSKAQPALDSVLSGSLSIERSRSIPLPEGRWRVRLVTEQSYPGYVIKIVGLRSEEPDPLVPYLFLRWSLNSHPWGDPCASSGSSFTVDRHGTLPNQVLTKCSRAFASAILDRVESWCPASNASCAPWWKDLHVAVAESDRASMRSESMVMEELTVFRWRGAWARVEAFLRTGKHGAPASKIRDAARSGASDGWNGAIQAWSADYVRGLEDSFLNGRPSSVAKLEVPGSLAVEDRIRQMAESGRNQRPASPAPTAGSDTVIEQIQRMSPSVASQTARPEADLQSAVRPAGAGPGAPLRPTPAPAVTASPGPSAEDLSRLSAEVARLREELNNRPGPTPSASPPAAPQPNAAAAGSSARRLALVIGNDAYQSVTRLQNARSDARAIASLLTRMGYAVRVRTDLSERAMKDELRSFKGEVQGGDEVLFFFAGHGVQLAGANYLLPTDIRGDSEDQVRDDALPLQKVLDDLQERKARFALAIVDACRDNPFKASTGRSIGTRGLAATTAATGQMVMFSAGAGQQALDRLNEGDKDPNGLFTRVLLRELEKPGVSVDRVLRTVRTQVVEMARSVGHEQVPALYDQTVGEFYFRR